MKIKTLTAISCLFLAAAFPANVYSQKHLEALSTKYGLDGSIPKTVTNMKSDDTNKPFVSVKMTITNNEARVNEILDAFEKDKEEGRSSMMEVADGKITGLTYVFEKEGNRITYTYDLKDSANAYFTRTEGKVSHTVKAGIDPSKARFIIGGRNPKFNINGEQKTLEEARAMGFNVESMEDIKNRARVAAEEAIKRKEEMKQRADERKEELKQRGEERKTEMAMRWIGRLSPEEQTKINGNESITTTKKGNKTIFRMHKDAYLYINGQKYNVDEARKLGLTVEVY